MKLLDKTKLIIQTSSYVSYDLNHYSKLSIKDLEKIKALRTQIENNQRSCRYWDYRKYEYDDNLKNIITKINLNQINELSECTFEFISYICKENSKYNIDEIIEKIVKPFKGKEKRFFDIIYAGYTISQMEFILKNNLLYDSGYHKKFDYEKIYNNFKELNLNPSNEYANLIDISIILKFLKSYPELELSEKESILELAARFLHKEDIIHFFNIICRDDEKNHYILEEIKVILECKKWSMAQLSVLFKNCKKEDVFPKILELKN